MVSTPADVANFFWSLLGPRADLLSPKMLAEMRSFLVHPYLDQYGPNAGQFGYGLGLMNFTSMVPWGFTAGGPFEGHNGLTYGFGAQSGFNFKYKFAVAWVNNNEVFIGPNHQGDELYSALLGAVAQQRRLRRNQPSQYAVLKILPFSMPDSSQTS